MSKAIHDRFAAHFRGTTFHPSRRHHFRSAAPPNFLPPSALIFSPIPFHPINQSIKFYLQIELNYIQKRVMADLAVVSSNICFLCPGQSLVPKSEDKAQKGPAGRGRRAGGSTAGWQE
jgi:hypothetical protein